MAHGEGALCPVAVLGGSGGPAGFAAATDSRERCLQTVYKRLLVCLQKCALWVWVFVNSLFINCLQTVVYWAELANAEPC